MVSKYKELKGHKTLDKWMMLLLSSFSINYAKCSRNRSKSGIGLEFVKQLSKAGYNVYAGYRTFSQEMEDACNGMIQPLDVSQQQSVDDFTSNLPSSIDLLINNAGVADGRWQSIEEIDDNIALEVLNINAVGPVRMMKSISEKLSDGAKVVMITSLMASMEDCKTGRSYAYRASKAALNMFSLAMKNELKTRNISLLLMHSWLGSNRYGWSSRRSECG